MLNGSFVQLEFQHDGSSSSVGATCLSSYNILHGCVIIL